MWCRACKPSVRLSSLHISSRTRITPRSPTTCSLPPPSTQVFSNRLQIPILWVANFWNPWVIRIKMERVPLDLDQRSTKRRRLSSGDVSTGPDTVNVTIASDGDQPKVSSVQERQKEGKEKKNRGRRDRRATSYHKGELSGEVAEIPAGPKAPRLPKRQCALLIGFCGSGYNGMQVYAQFICSRSSCQLDVVYSQPPPLKTIEGTLFKALVEAGAVSQDNANDPVKVSLYFSDIPLVLVIL